jgi:hypothetical protein
MPRNIIPIKLIVDIKGEDLGNALLLYKIKDDANIGQQRSVSVKSALTRHQVRNIIQEAFASAKQSEGIQ